MALEPSFFYPRVARPISVYPHDLPHGHASTRMFPREMAALEAQITIFVSQLQQIFRIIEPINENMKVYGHEIRNLLILVSTEIEAQFRGVLKANNYKTALSGERMNTKDYVKLEAVFRLRDYAVAFPKFPWMEAVSPFELWTSASPTKSLSWYDAYNATKHDREENFARASLKNAIAAVSALAILATTQFGFDVFREGVGKLGEFFAFPKRPRWTIGDCYHGDWPDAASYPL